jgi:integrase
MNLKHRSGVRWGELIALRPIDLDFDGNRVVRIHRGVEQSRHGLAVKTTKNRQSRVSTFPASLVDPLRAWANGSAGPTACCSPAQMAASPTAAPSNGSGRVLPGRPAGR